MKELLEKILGQIKKTPSGVRAYEDLYHICLETQKTDIPLSVEYLKKLSDIIENRIPQSETDKELRSLFMLIRRFCLPPPHSILKAICSMSNGNVSRTKSSMSLAVRSCTLSYRQCKI